MSLELRSSEVSTIDSLWKTWESTTEFELEATFKQLDYTNFLNVVKYLRTYGLIEEPQPPKLNIIVAGGLRFTIVGEGAIQAYCMDNTLKGKLYHVLLKEKRQAVGASDIDLNEYGVRIKIRRELPLGNDDPRVLDTLAKWSTLPKSFRYIQRYSFTSMHHKGIVFDASFVRENKKDARGNYLQSTTFQGANINKQPVHYEVEVEALRGAVQKSLIFGIVTVLRGIHRSYVLVRDSIKKQVVDLMTTQTQAQKGGFPGSQPVTLRKENIAQEREAAVPNIRFEDYNVTDKADGLRALMVVARDGKIYMVDRNLNVYGTDRRLASGSVDDWVGTVLDGEWITTDADNKPMSRFYAFDIFNGRKGEDVSGRPFLVRSSEPVITRLAAMTEAVAALNNAEYTVAAIPKHHSLAIMMKTFQTSPETPEGIFKEAASVLDRLASTRPYHTDGLIFTPNNAPMPRNVNTWPAQMKWKPASMNSVDFLVVTEKERDSEGRPTATEAVATRFRDDTQQMVRYKTLRLFVGSSVDPALVDPRDTILNAKPYPSSTERARGEYRPVEFAPQPPDPMGALCYVALDAGITDAAGAAPAARMSSDSLDDAIYCKESGDPITDRTIVEMVYEPSNPAGWRWIPLRVRWDKTEKFARRQIGGTLNSEDVANDVWLSIHDPITETMIRTGSTTETADESATAAANQMYYQRRAPQRDLHKIRGLTDFHNQYIKNEILLARTLTAGASILDMSVGQAGDIHKWIRSKVRFVLGCDIALTGITDNKNGAYRRYLDQLIRSRGNPIPKMIFVQADSSARYADGSAGQTPLDRTLLRTLWGEEAQGAPPAAMDVRGVAAAGFDVASLMFTLHYFFKDVSSLNGLLRNISESLKVGGYFVGCCFDGDKVVSLLHDLPTGGMKRGTDGSSDIWTITKQYDASMVALPDDETGLGKAIDVGFISIGEAYTEYLVSWNYFVRRMTEIGMELLNPEELVTLGLQHSTNMFAASYDMAAAAGRNYQMTAASRAFSFLNRWFIFRRRTTGSVIPTVVAPALPEPIVPLAEVTSDIPPAADAPAEAPAAAAEAEATASAAVEAPAAAAAEAPVEAEATAPAAAAAALRTATGTAYPFYHKSAAKDDLKIKDKNWKRYISTFTPFTFRDIHNPSVMYTSLEAVLGAAKYQLATNKPELGTQIFSTVGNIHQAIVEEKQKLTEGKRTLTADEEATFIESEGTQFRNAQKPVDIRKTGAKFNADAWTNEAIESVLNDYLRQRFEGDAQFRKILEAVAAQNARLVYSVPKSASELCGTVTDAGAIEGHNLYGRALMKLVGLTY